jgi:hypothetical protein
MLVAIREPVLHKPMKKIIILTTLQLIVTVIFAMGNDDTIATRPFSNSVYFNVFGDASRFSINYERVLKIEPAYILTGKLGAGYFRERKIWENQFPPPKYFTIPHHLTANFGKRHRFIEVGMGGTFLSSAKENIYVLYPILGYRFHPSESNSLNFRIHGQFPLVGYNSKYLWFIPIGLSFGIGF